MRTTRLSLRTRLLLSILLPLVVVALVSVSWRHTQSKRTADDIFDRMLSALTLAISRDVIYSGGEALSSNTKDLINEAGAEQVFYHVHGPDGSFITGYAYPPIRPAHIELEQNKPTLFTANIRAEPVRAAQLIDHVSIDGVTGYATVTVWQSLTSRQAFANSLTHRTATIMSILTFTVAIAVWFGIRFGLKPLNELQEAIGIRSTNDLSSIKRPIPVEVTGIVGTLNHLFSQVANGLTTRDRFISDAAHQLRNPIAAIQSMAEAVGHAQTPEALQQRTEELLIATRHASRLSEQLLSFERAKNQESQPRYELLDANELVSRVCHRNGATILKRQIQFDFLPSSAALPVKVDRLLIEEAVQNLIDNALMHGGEKMDSLTLSTRLRIHQLGKARVEIEVRDNGIGIDNSSKADVFERFVQGEPSTGSGLGLAIVRQIMQLHQGSVHHTPNDEDGGVTFVLQLPFSPAVVID